MHRRRQQQYRQVAQSRVKDDEGARCMMIEAASDAKNFVYNIKTKVD